MVRLLALREAKVYFTARSKAKALKTRDAVLASNPEIRKENIKWLLLDLTDLKSINATANELKQQERKVDIISILISKIYGFN